MNSSTLILVFIALSFVTSGQIRTMNGMIYEDDPKHSGYVEGKVYKLDGTRIAGLVQFPYASDEVRFKQNEGKEYLKFGPNDLVGFTLKNDSFATLSNFSPEIFGITLKRFYKKGFAKILVDGPVTLFKHYSLQSIRNQQIVTVESYLIGRKEERFTTLETIPTMDNSSFNEWSGEFFKRDASLCADMKSGKFSFLNLRKIVTRYNQSYTISEGGVENCEVILMRLNKRELPAVLNIVSNDSIVTVLGPDDLVKLNFISRVNKICIGENCVYFRSDQSYIQYVECGWKEKETNPFVQLVSEEYALPYVQNISRWKLKHQK